MAYEASNFVKLSELKTLTQRTKAEIQAVSSVAADAIKYVAVSGNTVSFWKDAEHSGAADFTFDFPSELFLDQTRTTFVQNFAFNATTYPGATNPSLDGKPVMVLAVKGTTDVASGTANDTVSYSFLDVSALVDTYTIASGDSSKVLSIANNEITVHISSAANQAITVQNDGLHVDISGKADKVDRAASAAAHNPYDETTQAEQYAAFNASYSLNGKVALLDASGNLKDSGIGIATSAEVTEMLNEVYGTPSSGN